MSFRIVNLIFGKSSCSSTMLKVQLLEQR